MLFLVVALMAGGIVSGHRAKPNMRSCAARLPGC